LIATHAHEWKRGRRASECPQFNNISELNSSCIYFMYVERSNGGRGGGRTRSIRAKGFEYWSTESRLAAAGEGMCNPAAGPRHCTAAAFEPRNMTVTTG
jgi:hypothetical protein